MAEFVYDVIMGIPSLTPKQALTRCKDCKFADGYRNGLVVCGKEIGTFYSIDHDENWFCADGEQKE